MKSLPSPHRDYPTHDDNGILVCQHGNPVPGYCATCDFIFDPTADDTAPMTFAEWEQENGIREWERQHQAELDTYRYPDDPDWELL